jgi:hypothetical protein
MEELNALPCAQSISATPEAGHCTKMRLDMLLDVSLGGLAVTFTPFLKSGPTRLASANPWILLRSVSKYASS